MNGTSKVYKYTRNNKFLNEEERDFYEENGFLVKKNLIDHKVLDECKERFINLAENTVPRGKWMVVGKDPQLKAKNIQGEHVIDKIQFISYDDVFYKYISFEPMLDVIDSIIGSNISTIQSMIINKPPDFGCERPIHPIHQDMHYFPMEPANSIVAAWTAMEKANVSNGCLFVYPGTHKANLYVHDCEKSEIRSMYRKIADHENLLNGSSKMYLPMEKGDTVFFHPHLFHGSGPNVSERFRKSISSHYINSGSNFIDVKGTIHENVTSELINCFKKFGYPVDYREFWRVKTRLVRGEPGTFQHEFLDKF